MNIVTHTGPLKKRFGDLEAIRLISEAGFDGYDFSMFDTSDPIFGDDYLSYTKKIRDYADGLGIKCLQAHAPFGYIGSVEDFDKFVPLHLRCLEVCKVLGCPVIVVHPANNFSAEDNYKYLYSRLLPTAQKCGVKIATENMWNWKVGGKVTCPAACGTTESFCAHVDIANSPFMTACLDLGHAEMSFCEGAPALIRGLGKNRLGALHVHDNDIIHDSHLAPFHGETNWQEVITALREIGYDGSFTFESDSFFRHYPDELIPLALRHLYDIGKYFVTQIEK